MFELELANVIYNKRFYNPYRKRKLNYDRFHKDKFYMGPKDSHRVQLPQNKVLKKKCRITECLAL